MKLIELLNVLDRNQKVVIHDDVLENFNGVVRDIPWTMCDYTIYKIKITDQFTDGRIYIHLDEV